MHGNGLPLQCKQNGKLASQTVHSGSDRVSRAQSPCVFAQLVQEAAYRRCHRAKRHDLDAVPCSGRIREIHGLVCECQGQRRTSPGPKAVYHGRPASAGGPISLAEKVRRPLDDRPLRWEARMKLLRSMGEILVWSVYAALIFACLASRNLTGLTILFACFLGYLGRQLT